MLRLVVLIMFLFSVATSAAVSSDTLWTKTLSSTPNAIALDDSGNVYTISKNLSGGGFTVKRTNYDSTDGWITNVNSVDWVNDTIKAILNDSILAIAGTTHSNARDNEQGNTGFRTFIVKINYKTGKSTTLTNIANYKYKSRIFDIKKINSEFAILNEDSTTSGNTFSIILTNQSEVNYRNLSTASSALKDTMTIGSSKHTLTPSNFVFDLSNNIYVSFNDVITNYDTIMLASKFYYFTQNSSNFLQQSTIISDLSRTSSKLNAFILYKNATYTTFIDSMKNIAFDDTNAFFLFSNTLVKNTIPITTASSPIPIIAQAVAVNKLTNIAFGQTNAMTIYCPQPAVALSGMGVSAKSSSNMQNNIINHSITYPSTVFPIDTISLFALSPYKISYTSSTTNSNFIITRLNDSVFAINSSVPGSTNITFTATQVKSALHPSTASVSTTIAINQTFNKASQTISFNALPIDTFKVKTTQALTASSVLNSITFTSSNASVATVSGSTLTLTGIGTTTITASQAGDANYNAATPVTQTFTVVAKTVVAKTIYHVAKTPTTSIIDFPTNIMDTTKPFTVSLANPTGGTLTYSSTSKASFSSGVVTMTVGTSGIDTLTINQNATSIASADTIYDYSASAMTQIFTITKAKVAQVITFTPNSSTMYGFPKFKLNATAPGGKVTYSASNNLLTIDANDSVTINGAGIDTITASQAGNDTYNPASIAKTVTIAKKAPTIIVTPNSTIVYGTSMTISVTSNSPGLISFSTGYPSNTIISVSTSGIVTTLGTGNATTQVQQQASANYSQNAVFANFKVIKASQTITSNPIAPVTYGCVNFKLIGSSTSGLKDTFTSSDTTIAKIYYGDSIMIRKPGTTIITAYQNGNNNYNAATPVQWSLLVNQNPAITQRAADSIAAIQHVQDSLILAKHNSDSTTLAKHIADSTNAFIRAKFIQDSIALARHIADSTFDASSAPVVTLNYVNDQIISASSSNTIYYTATDNVGIKSRVISYSSDNSNTWQILDSSSNNSGSFIWNTLSPTNKAFIKITAYDATGNSTTSKVHLYVIGKPNFTSSENVSIDGNLNFSYKITYDIPGNPVVFKDTIIKMPSWMKFSNDSVFGKAVNKTGNDTMIAIVSSGDLSDTLILVVKIKLSTNTLNNVLCNKDFFGINIINRKITYGVNAGYYEITIYNVMGKIIYQEKEQSSKGLANIIPLKVNSTYIIQLKQNNRYIARKIEFIR